MAVQEILKQVRMLIARGEFEKAGNILFSNKADNENAELQALGARILNYTDGFEKAQSMFFDLETVWSDNFEVYKMHSQLLQENGAYNEAIGLGRMLMTKFPKNIKSYEIQAENYELAGMPQEALKICREAINKFPESADAFYERINRLTALDNIDFSIKESLEEVKAELNIDTLCASRENCSLMLRVFKSRTGVFAQQNKTGKSWGYFPIHKDLSLDDIRTHLKGEKTLGIYVTDVNNTTTQMVMDLDIKKPYVAAYNNSSDERRRLSGLLKESVRQLVEICHNAGILPLVEVSGNKGYHIWFFASEPIACKHWRTLAGWLLKQQHIMPEELSWEVFPKQDTVAADGIGNLVKLPLGIHQKTGKHSWFVEPESFEPFPDQFRILSEINYISKSDFEKILGTITIESCCDNNSSNFLEGLEVTSAKNNPGFKVVQKEREESEDFNISVKIPLPERNTIEVEKILSGCSPLWNIMEKAKREHFLEQNEIHALVSVFALLGEEGKVFVHQVLNQTEGYQPDIVNALIKKVSPNAISCKKLRKTIPDFCNSCDCNCQFRLPAGSYDSPLVHAGIFPGTCIKPTAIATIRQPARLSDAEMMGGESGGIDRLMQEYMKITDEINALKSRAALLKRQINKIFSDAGKDVIETRIRSYHRLPENNE